eukprot:TRINITY_DN6825_c0_g2_i7.p1 TRINITY_DN6825_c0_g2~~TRINITY_DN6825_c0_g2_i7.p1  ORF type:complete len:118 (-),score=35.64 TRINITY_DN6825_c0_g2_i7:58-411(-)
MISRGRNLSVESICKAGATVGSVTNFNELTNHWLNVTIGRCVRQRGPLTDEEIKKTKEVKLTEEEREVVELIKKMKSEREELLLEEIFDRVKDPTNLLDFEKLLETCLLYTSPSPRD